MPSVRPFHRSPDAAGSSPAAPIHSLDYAHQPTLGGVICHDLPGDGVAIRVVPSRRRKLRAALQQVGLVVCAILVPYSVIYTQWNDWMRHGPPWWGIITLLLLSGVGLVWSSILFANTFFPVFIQSSGEQLSTTSGLGLFSRHRAWPADQIEDVYRVHAWPGEGGGTQVHLRTRTGFVYPLLDASPEEATYIAERLRQSLGRASCPERRDESSS